MLICRDHWILYYIRDTSGNGSLTLRVYHGRPDNVLNVSSLWAERSGNGRTCSDILIQNADKRSHIILLGPSCVCRAYVCVEQPITLVG